MEFKQTTLQDILDSEREMVIRGAERYGRVYAHAAQMNDFIHTLIDSITVHSRPVNEFDKITGKKRPNQRMPNSLSVKLRLPQEFLNNAISSSNRNSQNRVLGGNRTPIKTLEESCFIH